MDAILLGELTDILGSMSTNSETKHEEIKSLLNTIDANTAISAQILQNKGHGNLYLSGQTSQNWVCPEGVKNVLAIMVSGSGGGGGGGGGYGEDQNGTQTYGYACRGASGGSGGSGCGVIILIPVESGVTYTLVAGGGGAGGTAGKAGKTTTAPTAGGNGGSGGATKFGDVIVLPGGGGGGGGKGISESNTAPAAGAAGSKAVLPAGMSKYLILDFVKSSNRTAGSAGVPAGRYGVCTAASITGAAGVDCTWANNTTGKIHSSGSGGSGGGYTANGYCSGYGGNGAAGGQGSVGQSGFIRLYW